MVIESDVEKEVDEQVRKKFTRWYDAKVNHPFGIKLPPGIEKAIERGYNPELSEKEKLKTVNPRLAEFVNKAEKDLKRYAPSLTEEDLTKAAKHLYNAATHFQNYLFKSTDQEKLKEAKKELAKAQEELSRMHQIGVKR